MMSRVRRVIALGLVWGAACSVEVSAEGEGDLEAGGVGLTSAQQVQVVKAVNHEATTVGRLQQAGIAQKTALSLISHRDGPDGKRGTVDDDLYDSFAELDAVPGTGVVTVSRLCAYARELLGEGGGGVFEGIEFSAVEMTATLEFVNHASRDELVQGAQIGSAAARNIVAHRPFATMEALATVAYVGPVTLRSLRDFAAT